MISIHALREEGDRIGRPPVFESKISIHALREEGDCACRLPLWSWPNFYPRPPRGGRQYYYSGREQKRQFLSTPSARRATCIIKVQGGVANISIHALREEGDKQKIQRIWDVAISIHALREEGDCQS